MARPVFLDTSCLIASLHPADALHERACRVFAALERERAPLVTSHWVFVEFLNGASSPKVRVRAAETVSRLARSGMCRVIEADALGFADAVDLYSSRPDKEWSLVDCASMRICSALKVQRVFTADHHFRQAGFETLL